MRQKLVWTAGVAAGLGITVMWLGFGAGRHPGFRAGSDKAEAPRPVVADLLTVKPASAAEWLEATGTVHAELDAPIAARVSGRVLAVLAREGDAVRHGQPLVKLDARDLDAGVAQAAANLRAAEVGFDNSRVAATMEDSVSKAKIAAAQAQLAQAQAALQEAQARAQQVETGPRKQERAQASLAVAQAKANLDLADSTLKRMESLAADGAISAQQYDTARTAREVAQAQFNTAIQSQSLTDEGSRSEERRQALEAVRQAQAAVGQAQAGLRQAKAAALQANVKREEVRGARAQVGQMDAALRIAEVTRDYATIVTPFDGVVSARLVDPGAMATPGTPLLRIQGGRIRLEAVVPESALSVVRVGAAIPVRLDALPGKSFTGRVSEITPQGDPASHTFVAKLDLPHGSGAKAGMFGRAQITTGRNLRVLVPGSALIAREGLTYVFVVGDDGEARLRIVTIGDPHGARVPVLSGLNEGEQIVATGVDRISDGMKVRGR